MAWTAPSTPLRRVIPEPSLRRRWSAQLVRYRVRPPRFVFFAVDPWTDALTPEQETAAWEVMQPYLETTGIDTVDSFLFGRRDDVPTWAGYTIGFHIVQAFLQKTPEASVPSWTALDSREMLTRSGYSGER